MRRLLPLLPFFLLSIVSVKAQTNVSGVLTGNATWTKANSPYILTGTVGIPATYTLTIEAGVTVQRTADFQLLVLGAVNILGTQSDSVVFRSGSALNNTSLFFLDFQKSNLNNSVIRYLSFRKEGAANNNIRVGNEGEFAQTSPKNSGTLKVSRSCLNYGFTVTKGYLAATSLDLDSCVAYAATIYGYYPNSEKINITNSELSGCSVESASYNKGILLYNTKAYNCIFLMGCCDANLSFLNSKLQDCKIGYGSGNPVNGPLTITNSLLLNTSIHVPDARAVIENSKFIVSKKIFTTDNAEITYLISVGNLSLSKSELINKSIYNYGGILINGKNGYDIAGANIITKNRISNVYDGFYVTNFASLRIDSNNFINSGRYHINNHSSKDFTAAKNYFQLKSGQSYYDVIYDAAHDLLFGTVNYQPASATPFTLLSPAPPSGVVKRSINDNTLVSWKANQETDVKRYRVYWGYVDDFTFAHSADVAATDTSFIITGPFIGDSVAVTASNTALPQNNDQANGYESWFTSALFNATPATAVPPSISSFTPESGAAGTPVTINGANFNTSKENLLVYFGTTPATITSSSSTQLVVTAPAGATYQPISVLHEGTRLAGYATKPFRLTFLSNNLIEKSNLAAQAGITTGVSPRTVAAGDLDGDGKPDLVVSNQGAAIISIYRNTSTIDSIKFAQKTDLATGSNPYSIAIGDLDGDGRQDLVVVNFNSGNAGSISIFRNTGSTGNISFAAKSDVAAGNGPIGVAIADLNEDGKPDVAVTAGNSQMLYVFRNITTAAGTILFDAKVEYPTPNHSDNLAIGDFDGDGHVDVAITDFSGARVSVLRNTTGTSGVLSLTSQVNFTVGTSPANISVGDIDGDGKMDMAVSNYQSNTVSVLRNTGSTGALSFAAKKDYPAGLISSVSLGDLDGDGKPDMIVANNNTNNISVLRNTSVPGTVSFADTINFSTGIAPTTMAVVDANGDGKPDVFIANSNAASLSVYKNIRTEQPAILSFLPNHGTTGDTILIKGANLTGTGAVYFGGVTATAFAVDSSRGLRAVVGGGASGQVAVNVNGIVAALPGFTYDAAAGDPVISSFNPTHASPGDTVRIKGRHLSATSFVAFGNITATSFTVGADSVIIAVVAKTVSGNISVTANGIKLSLPGFVFDSIPSTPVVSFAGTSSLCPGKTVTLRSSASSASQWYKDTVAIGGATGATYTTDIPGTYSVRAVSTAGLKSNLSISVKLLMAAQPKAVFSINDTVQCLTGNSFVFTNKSSVPDTSVLSATWNFGNGITQKDTVNVTNIYAATGGYPVKLIVTSNKGCTDTATIQATVQSSAKPKITNPAAICAPGAIDITSSLVVSDSTGRLTRTFWNDSLAVSALTNAGAITRTGKYYVKVIDTNGCYHIQPISVTVNLLPVIPAIAGDTSVCVNAKIKLTNTAKNGIWSVRNALVAGLTDTSTVFGKTAGSAVVSYSITSAENCTDSVTKAIEVKPLPITGKPILANYPSDTLVCFFTTLAIKSQNSFDIYRWSTGETTQTINVSANATVSLKVGATATGCFSDSSVIIIARKNTTPQPTLTRSGDSLTSSGSLAYKWLFNNKVSPGDTGRILPISSRGIYNVSTSADRVCWNTSSDYLVVLNPLSTVQQTFVLATYPNPSNGIFNVQVKFTRNTSALINITLTDATGILKWTGKKVLFNDKSIKIPVGLILSKGIYTLRIEVNGEVSTQQIVII
jgi:hypothetical protein